MKETDLENLTGKTPDEKLQRHWATGGKTYDDDPPKPTIMIESFPGLDEFRAAIFDTILASKSLNKKAFTLEQLQQSYIQQSFIRGNQMPDKVTRKTPKQQMLNKATETAKLPTQGDLAFLEAQKYIAPNPDGSYRIISQ